MANVNLAEKRILVTDGAGFRGSAVAETNAPYGMAKKMLRVQAQAYRDQSGHRRRAG